MTREDITEINPDAILYDGLDDAIIGMAERITMNPVVAYDRHKTIQILFTQMIVEDSELPELESMGMSVEDRKYEMAMEHFDYNILGGWLGENTPIFVTLNAYEQEEE